MKRYSQKLGKFVEAINREDIVRGLRALGLGQGDIILVHSSLSRFGWVEGGVEAVVDGLLEAVGEEGTLATPSFAFSLGHIPSPTLDILNTPSEMGIISESIRRRAGANRSPHLTHSISAIGNLAAGLTSEHSRSPCDKNSPFYKLRQLKGYNLFLGVSLNSCTTLHTVEEEHGLFYVGYRDIPGATLIDAQGKRRPLNSQVHNYARKYDFNRLEQPLLAEGIMKRDLIGESLVRLVRADELCDLAGRLVDKDASALLRIDEKRLRTPITRDEFAQAGYDISRP